MDLSKIDTPALLVDKDKVAANIKLAIQYAGGTDRLRPHVKTHKMLEVARMQMAAGIYQFKCSTIAEGEMLGMAGAKDVLMAYPVQGPKINRVAKLVQRFPETSFSVLIDNEVTARQIDEVFGEAGLELDVFIDLNNGHFRTGIIPERVPALVAACQELARLKIIGLHCYDGHIRMSSLEERIAACREAFKPIAALREQLSEVLGRRLKIVAGGSPSFSVHAKYHDVACSPGTWIFWDERYGNDYREQEFQKAAVIATRVISKLDAHTYCLDVGHKSIASEMPFPRMAFKSPHQFTQFGHSEEHLIIKSVEPDVLQPGEILLAYPMHVCPTVALHDYAHIISAGEIVDQWKVIARTRKITL
ncbi:D-TA family PLP-dependent enzyme [Neolewinella persica]|uniref:D-TA family PLP-dependent enzyme n=1 Tax=Neolewinella persica TaxID=70998 RepID=UPI000374FE67|nr:D-TA family PLP-dependent enzyme [Neolewinella persica]